MQSHASSLSITIPSDRTKASVKPSRFHSLTIMIRAWLLQCPFLVDYIMIIRVQLDQISSG